MNSDQDALRVAGRRVPPKEQVEAKPPEEMVFDRHGFLDRVDGDRELAQQVLGVFLSDFGGKIEVLKEALGNGQFDDVGRLGHMIKGTTANLGALRLHAVARRLEQAAEKGDLDRADHLVKMLEQEFRTFRLYPPVVECVTGCLLIG